jgi:hypothetical protein
MATAYRVPGFAGSLIHADRYNTGDTEACRHFSALPFMIRFGCNPLMALELPLETDPVIEAYKKHVDRTLIRRNLSPTVEERIIRLIKLQEFADQLRRAGRAAGTRT